MATKSKSTGKQTTTDNQATAAGKAPETNAADWAQQVVEHLVDAQKKWIDLTAQQNALVIRALKAGLNLDDNSPAAALADFAQQAVTNYVEVQKRWLDLATQLPFMGAPGKKK